MSLYGLFPPVFAEVAKLKKPLTFLGIIKVQEDVTEVYDFNRLYGSLFNYC
jgi:hypothetical protein